MLLRRCGWSFLLTGWLPAVAADLPFVNWENHPIHALDASADGQRLAVAHTADARVQLFALGPDGPQPAGSVEVGLDPVAVRFRGNDELWVVNQISDSISIVDLPTRRVRATLATGDAPYDVVFAGGKAFVSCSRESQVWVFDPDHLNAAARIVALDANDPRALAVSPDGRTVAVAMFQSGNGSTILAGGMAQTNRVFGVPNVVNDPRGPYAGVNPPPNAGRGFQPAIDPRAQPPKVGLIVRQNAAGAWMDDNNGDWTRLVSGDLAAASGRRPGWTLLDRDLALIDSNSLAVRYESGLLNIGMALAVNPGSGEYTLVGTDANNQIRYEPNLRGTFVRAELVRVGAAHQITDLNPQLDYVQRQLPQAQRALAIGDPRAIAWNADGSRGWVAGMGSNNVVEIDAQGRRVGDPIAVGEGPVGLVVDAARDRLYVWNHFEAALSVVGLSERRELQRLAVFNPLPAAIRAGRRFLYDSHRTSGLGQASCASCHVDARTDRLAWDLGDPAQAPAAFDQNCVTSMVKPCEAFQSMKGPMLTQTLQDIIGHEPFHWRGDRAGIEAFNPAFEFLLGSEQRLSDSELQQFKDFLGTIHFPPNPHRTLENALPRALELRGQYTSGRFALAGQPLGRGDAQRGLQLYTQGLLAPPFQCASCHTLPTGMAVNGPLRAVTPAANTGGQVMPIGALGENHLGVVSLDGSTNVSMKVPQLRDLYERVGFETTQSESRAGFGFIHDGSVDSLPRFISASVFAVASDQDVADMTALLLAFSGSDFPLDNPRLGAAAPTSQDTHAGVGQQQDYRGGPLPQRIERFVAIAKSGKVDLVVRGGGHGYVYQAGSDRYLSDAGESLAQDALLARAGAGAAQQWMLVPKGLGRRLGLDRDGDGVSDAAERGLGSDPTDAASHSLRPFQGLWFNPARGGHGFDLQRVGDVLALTWYTYDDDGKPTWYQAVATYSQPWRADLLRHRWDAQRRIAEVQTVGSVRLDFSSAQAARFDWQIGARGGSEAMQPLLLDSEPAVPNHTGIYHDPNESGWGLSIASDGANRGLLIYYYDDQGAPRWALGLGDNRGREARIDMLSFRGFCPDCPAVPVTSTAVGSADLRSAGPRSLQIDIDVHDAGLSRSAWQRRQLRLVPLSDPVDDFRWR